MQQKKKCLLFIRRKSVTKLKVTPKGRKEERKVGPKAFIQHSACFELMRRERIRKEMRENYANNFHMLMHLTHFWPSWMPRPVFCFCIAAERGDWNQTTKQKARKRLPTLLLLLNCRVILLSSLNNFHCNFAYMNRLCWKKCVYRYFGFNYSIT